MQRLLEELEPSMSDSQINKFQEDQMMMITLRTKKIKLLLVLSRVWMYMEMDFFLPWFIFMLMPAKIIPFQEIKFASHIMFRQFGIFNVSFILNYFER